MSRLGQLLRISLEFTGVVIIFCFFVGEVFVICSNIEPIFDSLLAKREGCFQYPFRKILRLSKNTRASLQLYDTSYRRGSFSHPQPPLAQRYFCLVCVILLCYAPMEDDHSDDNSNCSEGDKKNAHAKIGIFICNTKALLGRDLWRLSSPVS